MNLHSIRRFRIDEHIYRHAMCGDSDAVFLQQYTENEDATCHDDLWITLLKYSPDCQVLQPTPDGEKRVGNFEMEGDAWVMYENPLRTRVVFPPNRSAESLLDAEVLYSQRWLAQEGSTSARPSDTSATPSDTHPQ